MKNGRPLRTLVSAAVMSVSAANMVHATGFALYGESAGYTAGNYAAGAAAEAADASTGWYNPAGLALLREQQAVFGGTGVFPEIKINGTSTYTTNLPFIGPVSYEQQFEGLNGAYSAFVPAAHYALPVGERTTIGLSITAPFGLATDWDTDSAVRYAATFTELLTANISPEIGTRLTDNFAVGAGLDLQYSRVKFNQMIGAPTILELIDAAPASFDSLSYNKGQSFGVGFHVGVMGMFNDNHTRVGVNYQSRIRHTFYGYSRLTGALANEFNVFQEDLPTEGHWRYGHLFSDPVQFPDVLTLSAYHDVNDKLALLGSVVYTGWSVFDRIQLNSVVAPSVGLDGDVEQASLNVRIPQNFKDAWRVAIGANYHVNPKLMLRVGGGYDQTPTNNTDRNIRLPDVNRWAVAVGAHYQMKPTIGFDIGYTHLFAANNPTINATQALPPISSYSVDSPSGNFSADLVGAQVVWVLDKPMPMPTK